MKLFNKTRAFGGALIAAACLTATASRADIKDYEFQLVSPNVKKSDGAVLAVRLVHKPDGKPVSDAVIFTSRLDMEPEGMPTMAAALQTLPSTEPGIYRFKAAISMAGGWALSLGAKVQGETGTVQNKLVIKVVQ